LFFPLKIKFSNGIVSIVHQPAIHGIGDFKKKFSGDTFEILKKIAVEGFTPHTPPNAFIPFETFVSSPYADPSSGLITKETTGDSFSIAFSGPVLGSSFLPSVSEGFVGAAPPQRIIRVLIKLRRGLSGASEAQAKAFYRRELSRLGLPVSFVTRETTEHHRVVSIDL
jgi:hypothetical protein